MPDEDAKVEAKLEKLRKAVRYGWAKLHPATQAHRAVVRRVVRQQWRQEAKIQAEQKQSSQGKGKSKQAKPTQTQNQKGKSKGHDHGHSH